MSDREVGKREIVRILAENGRLHRSELYRLVAAHMDHAEFSKVLYELRTEGTIERIGDEYRSVIILSLIAGAEVRPTIRDVGLKVQTLEKLAGWVHPEVAAVLDAIRDDYATFCPGAGAQQDEEKPR